MVPRSKSNSEPWEIHVKTAWAVDPRIALALVARFPGAHALRTEVTSMVQVGRHPHLSRKLVLTMDLVVLLRLAQNSRTGHIAYFLVIVEYMYQLCVSVSLQAHILDLINVPEALHYVVTPAAVAKDSDTLNWLPHWALCSITQALKFLTPQYKGHSRVMAYVLRVMESYPPERVTFFMPQLVQALRYDHGVNSLPSLSGLLEKIFI